MSGTPQWQGAVVPACLSFLAIYNPSLGLTDETFQDQLVFYHSRAAHDARLAARKNARNDGAGGDAVRAAENEKLRQIGLAQGMVDFARSFSDDKQVDAIDTEKSRIVLQELEKDWWILASIDLTRLPALSQSSSDSSKKGAEKVETKPAVEYSAREVSPSALLLQQLVQAHHIFTLHHGPSLTELFIKLPKERFCSTLDRYWTRFARTWDVMLHGNPAVDIFGGIKLSSGGELGMGVGEEEWGSGERDVLEDLIRRTEGLIDLVVSRFGEPTPLNDKGSQSEDEAPPWMGCGNHPQAADGVIFGGVNGITRPSLRNVSLWMRNIYTTGEYAYGVRDNPLRERRKRRRRITPQSAPETEAGSEPEPRTKQNRELRSAGVNARDHAMRGSERLNMAQTRRALSQQDPAASEDFEGSEHPHHSGIPPPIVSAAQASLDKATGKANSSHDQLSPEDDPGTTLGIPDQYMKYLTFGLSTLAKSSPQGRPNAPRRTSTSSSKTIRAVHHQGTIRRGKRKEKKIPETNDAVPVLTTLDPRPDEQILKERIAVAKRLEETGVFVVGLRGDLNGISNDVDADFEDADDEDGGLRNVLRTLQVEVVQSPLIDGEKNELDQRLSDAGLPPAKNDPLNFKRVRVLVYVHRPFMYCFLFEDRTPSLSMARFYKDLHESLLPIQRPLLISTSADRIEHRIQEAQLEATPSASDSASIMSGGGKSQKSSDPKPIYDLIFDPALLTVHTSILNIPEPGTPAAEGIFATRKDIRSPAGQEWTRVEALNVHSQIVNTFVSTKRNVHEYERTSKTGRGWWVVWMKLPPSKRLDTASTKQAESQQRLAQESRKQEEEELVQDVGKTNFELPAPLEHTESDDTAKSSWSGCRRSKSKTWLTSVGESTTKPRTPLNRIAFLVRKASETTATPHATTVTSRAASSMWQSLSLRSRSMADESTGGASAGWGPGALAGGIGVDARKYVEGLLALNR